MAEARTALPESTLVGVIGSPIAHSLSPLLHNSAFVALGLEWRSRPYEIAPGQADQAMSDLRRYDLRGLSVTMPHKADVAALVDEMSDTAARLGAVNCVINQDGMLRGENTDGAGFVAALARAAAFDPAGARCVVAGAGGAARAVVLALADAGASDVAVINRTAGRAETAATLAGPKGRVVGPAPAEVEASVAQADLVVNATPIGMAGVGGDGSAVPSMVPPSLLHRGQVVADLVYVPRPTPWLAEAGAAGATTVDGLGMLVHQAAIQIELWTGLEAPVDVMWQAASGRS